VRREGTSIPVHTAVSYVIEACDAIAEAHRLGIIHRDLKPANLFLARRPDGRTRVKVLDFGISKFADAVGGSQPSMTKTSAVMGSGEYMSPEQMISTRDADPRTDIWALGVTLFELLTGRVPFPGETITHVCALVMTTTADAPSKLRSDVPAGLDDILAKCLMRDRSARYAGVAELVAALAPFAMPQAAQSRESGATLALPGVGVGAVAGTSRSVMDSSGLSSGLSSGGIQDEETALQDDGTASTDRAPAIGASVPSRDLPDIIRTTGFPGSSGTRALPDRPGTRVSGVGLGQAASTTGVVSSEPISLPRKSSSRLWVGGIAALVVGGIALSVWGLGGAGAPSPGASAPLQLPTNTVAAPAPPAPAPPAPAPPAVAPDGPIVTPATTAVAAEPSASASSARPPSPLHIDRSAKPTAKSPAPALSAPATPPAPSAPSPPPPPPAGDRCNPPYTLDAAGIKTPKPGCR